MLFIFLQTNNKQKIERFFLSFHNEWKLNVRQFAIRYIRTALVIEMLIYLMLFLEIV